MSTIYLLRERFTIVSLYISLINKKQGEKIRAEISGVIIGVFRTTIRCKHRENAMPPTKLPFSGGLVSRASISGTREIGQCIKLRQADPLTLSNAFALNITFNNQSSTDDKSHTRDLNLPRKNLLTYYDVIIAAHI